MIENTLAIGKYELIEERMLQETKRLKPNEEVFLKIVKSAKGDDVYILSKIVIAK